MSDSSPRSCSPSLCSPRPFRRAASRADVVIYVGGLNHSLGLDSEAADRKDMKLPYGQDELLRRVVEANPRTVVVLLGGGPVEMGAWLSRAPAVLLAWYPGMEGGNAVARVLFGDVNPSGKLPFTFPKRLEDSPAHALGAYPGKDGVVRYEEGLLVGYRWFDTKEVEPLFPFGHGLSYTSFEYSNLKLVEGKDDKGPAVTVEFDVTNAGAREGAEAAQVYVRDVTSSLPRPLKELKGFAKVFLKAGREANGNSPARTRRLRLLRPAEARLGRRARRVQDHGRKLVARHEAQARFQSGDDDLRAVSSIRGRTPPRLSHDSSRVS